METILVIAFLAIVVAALSGRGPAEPPPYRIEIVPPEQPAGGRGHLIIAVALMLLIILMLASVSA
jgi:hypothetical protein